MGGTEVLSALRDKKLELRGAIKRLEEQMAHCCAGLTHLDATIGLFSGEVPSRDRSPVTRRVRSSWFRPGECLRRIYDVLREATHPLTTKELIERVIDGKGMPVVDDRTRGLIQKTMMGSLRRATDTIERIETTGVVRWRLR